MANVNWMKISRISDFIDIILLSYINIYLYYTKSILIWSNWTPHDFGKRFLSVSSRWIRCTIRLRWFLIFIIIKKMNFWWTKIEYTSIYSNMYQTSVGRDEVKVFVIILHHHHQKKSTKSERYTRCRQW